MTGSTTRPEDDSSAPEGMPEDPRITFNPSLSAIGIDLVSSEITSESMPIPPVHRMQDSSALTAPPPASLKTPTQEFVFPPSPNEFQMHRLVGRGGFGEVWEATQPALGREIAVKRLRGDLLLRSGESRAFSTSQLEVVFRQEGLTTAQLEHPNIVPIHDLGFDEDGRPLLAMKLVRGLAWDEVMQGDFDTMAPADFLGKHIPTLINVGNAVAFAHSRGIIHRDLKPSQVMIGEFGEVLLMDWGLALVYDVKALQERMRGMAESIAPPLTDAINPAGTTAFMAPEQTQDTALNLGPWTDVFLLGATLYYMLTGTLLHPGNTSKAAFIQAMHCKIEPPRQRKPDREIPDELAEVAMQALRPDPKDRTVSAAEFVKGLQEYLSGATKRRESVRLAKLVEEQLKSSTGDYQVLGELSSHLANARGLWADNAAIPPLREQVLERFARCALRNGDLVLARIQAARMDQGPATDNVISDITTAEEHAARHASQRKFALAASFLFLLVIAMGGWFFLRAQKAANVRLAESNENLRTERDRADRARGDAEELVGFIMGDLKVKLGEVGRLDAMEEAARKALEYYDKLPLAEMSVPERVQQMSGLGGLADVFASSGKTKEAADLYRRLVEELSAIEATGEEKSHINAIVARSLGTLGWLEYQQGEREQGIERFNKSIELGEELVRNHPEEPLYRRDLSVPIERLGMIRFLRGEYADAEPYFKRILELRQQVVAEEPDQVSWKRELSTAYYFLGEARRGQKDIEGALANFFEAEKTVLALSGQDPKNTKLQRQVSSFQISIGDAYRDQKKYDEALGYFEKASVIREALAELEPRNTGWQSDLCVVSERIGIAHKDAGRLEKSLPYFERSVQAAGKLRAMEPNNLQWLQISTTDNVNLADALGTLNRTDEAIAAAQNAIRGVDELLAKSPGEPAYLRLRMYALQHLAENTEETGALEQSLVQHKLALEGARDYLARLPGNADAIVAIAYEMTDIAENLYDLGDQDEAKKMSAEVIGYMDQHPKEMDPIYSKRGRISCLLILGRDDEAEVIVRELLETDAKLGERVTAAAMARGWIAEADVPSGS